MGTNGITFLTPMSITFTAAVSTAAAQSSTSEYVIQDPGSLSSAPDRSYGLSVNDNGQVVGMSHVAPGPFTATLAGKDAKFQRLFGDTVNNQATSIKAYGSVVGTRFAADGSHAFVFRNGGMQDLTTVKTNLPNTVLRTANCINNLNQMVVTDGANHTYLLEQMVAKGVDPAYWESGRLSELGDLGFRPNFGTHINNAGQIVGKCQDYAGNWRAFLWNRDVNTRGIELPTPGVGYGTEQTVAYCSNINGQAVAYVILANGPFPVLWTVGGN